MNLKNHEVFTEELNQISNKELRNFIINFLDTKVPKYFYQVPASSSGKYHPKQDLGEGGLVRHTKAVVRVALDLLRCEQFVEDNIENKDVVISTCLLHDTFKNGKEDNEHTEFLHPTLAKVSIQNYYIDVFTNDKIINTHVFQPCTMNTIALCVNSHMGKWNTDKNYEQILPKPTTEIEKLVHLADYIASRKYINFEDLQQGDK